jgi:protocatechuate 3,4-dioxygenase beta subunit
MVMLCSVLVAVSLSQAPAAADAPGRLAGRVTVEGSAAPVAGARIMLFPAGRPNGPMGPPPQTQTDQDGRFAFDRVIPGSYRVDVQKTGFAPPDPLRAQPVQVAAGQAVDGLELHLQKGAVISGKLLDPRGEPLPDARVIAMRKVSLPRESTPRLIPAPGQSPQTNDLGEFRLAGLAPGEYFIAATPRTTMPMMMPGPSAARATTSSANTPRTTIATTYYPGTADQGAAQPIAVTAGAEVGNITFTMQSVPAFRVSGIVVDESGNPVAGAMVMLMSDPRSGTFMGPAGGARSQENGRFEIVDVPPGSYRANGSVPMMMGSSSGGGSVGGVAVSSGSSASWSSTGGGGVATSTVVAGVTGGVFGAVSSGPPLPAAEFVVTDAEVTGVRVTVRQPAPR